MKLKVCELATGNKFTEEWDFLPKNWKNALDTTLTIFDKNFVYLEFEENYDPDAGELGDVLILNLATRQKFWMDRREIRSKIRMKIPDIDLDGEPFILTDFEWGCAESIIHRMKAKSNEIEMKHQSIIDYDQIFLGKFFNHTLTF